MEKTCGVEVWADYGSHSCGVKASIERNGKFYCKRHDPEREKAKKAAWNSAYNDKSAAQERVWKIKQMIAEKGRKMFPELYKELDEEEAKVREADQRLKTAHRTKI